ncbi:helix-turn-helix domain-containing protein [Sphingobacterium faecale]|uniref:Helix-turn-helix domain-containing protein n=1 Tax=Sphingobacterium faecale TaxID=2803775 RepID=A0ABS1RAH2_9SPHI|nr:helix-turn-helix domain-containing protein [Sphingobacterium faecale]MBL1411234.1 helix-turn-helix domain-containing protein [Sphingobacterium faecale]
MKEMLQHIIDQQSQTNFLLSQQNEFLKGYLYPVADNNTEPQPVVPVQKPEVLPRHLTVSEVIDYFEVSQATFYRNIKDVLIHPVNKVGNRPYYLYSDVEEVMKHIPAHEKGAWTFKKLKNRMKDG